MHTYMWERMYIICQSIDKEEKIWHVRLAEVDVGPAVQPAVKHGARAGVMVPAHGLVKNNAPELVNNNAPKDARMTVLETAMVSVPAVEILALQTALAVVEIVMAFALVAMIYARPHVEHHAVVARDAATVERHVVPDVLRPAQTNVPVPAQMAVPNSAVAVEPAVRQTVQRIVDLDARTHVTAR